ncbi:MAG: PAS domain-containing protein [Verrucomicrobia bacterium]|nr:PAS domain-containing protein [Verrucomicrobiota bacterium]
MADYFVTTLAERLRENERRLETMADRALAGQQLLEQALETSGAGLRVLDRDLRCYWANLRWQEWFGGSSAQTGQAFELLNGESSPARQTLKDAQIRMTEMALENAGSAASELSQANRHGRVFQITTAPLRDLSGNVHRIVELAQDITQQKQTQAQMLRAGKLAAVGELAGQVAHEVNNPIAIVIAKINLLIADYGNVVPAEAAQELDKIADLTGRVARIAQGLLSYCRPSAALRAALDVREPIRKCFGTIEQPAQNRGVQIEDRLPESVPAIKGNANELEQVFLNLFLNALDAMPHGGRLTVSARGSPAAFPQGQGAFDMVVEDTGIGIPAGIRERIFEPFFSTKEEGRGTGLGLSICHGLVRSDGGEVLVETEPGRGTRFIVRLPIETAVTEEASYG